MRKTKIICTLGPATDDENILRELMLNGMDVARVNMSHQDHHTHKVRIDSVKKLRSELDMPIAVLLDTKGPEIRTGDFAEKVILRSEIYVDNRRCSGRSNQMFHHIQRASE